MLALVSLIELIENAAADQEIITATAGLSSNPVKIDANSVV